MVKKSLKNPLKFCQKLISEFTNVVSHINDFANESAKNRYTFLNVRIWELGTEDGIILEKIFTLLIFENLEKQAR